MSNLLMTEIWNNESLNITGSETHLLVKLADFAENDGTDIYPSLTTLAKLLRVEITTVKRSLNSLIKKGYLFKRKHGGKKRKGYRPTNSYMINLNAVCRSEALNRIINHGKILKLVCG